MSLRHENTIISSHEIFLAYLSIEISYAFFFSFCFRPAYRLIFIFTWRSALSVEWRGFKLSTSRIHAYKVGSRSTCSVVVWSGFFNALRVGMCVVISRKNLWMLRVVCFSSYLSPFQRTLHKWQLKGTKWNDCTEIFSQDPPPNLRLREGRRIHIVPSSWPSYTKTNNQQVLRHKTFATFWGIVEGLDPEFETSETVKDSDTAFYSEDLYCQNALYQWVSCPAPFEDWNK